MPMHIKSLSKSRFVKVVIVLIVLAFFLTIIFGWGIYRRGWQGKIAYGFSAVIPYPVIMVDWEGVKVISFFDDFRTLKKYWSVQSSNSRIFSSVPSDQEIKNTLIEKLIDKKIIQIWARKNNISVSQ